jgi:hypothetical protein
LKKNRSDGFHTGKRRLDFMNLSRGEEMSLHWWYREEMSFPVDVKTGKRRIQIRRCPITEEKSSCGVQLVYVRVYAGSKRVRMDVFQKEKLR